MRNARRSMRAPFCRVIATSSSSIFSGSMCLVSSDFTPHTGPVVGTWGLTDKSGIKLGFGKVIGTLNFFNFDALQTLTFSGISANGP